MAKILTAVSVTNFRPHYVNMLQKPFGFPEGVQNSVENILVFCLSHRVIRDEYNRPDTTRSYLAYQLKQTTADSFAPFKILQT